MYDFVYSSDVSQYREICSDILTKLQSCLKKEHDINTQFTLVGLRSENLVMRNGFDPLEMDYNLQIIGMADEYRDNLFKLKNAVRDSLNNIAGSTWFYDNFSRCAPAMSSLLYFKNAPNENFRFSVDIIKENDHGGYSRLIFQGISYAWCDIPHSEDIKKKAAAVKNHGAWSDVREAYKDLKNQLLLLPCSAFTLYVEAVHRVYTAIKSSGKGENAMKKKHGVSGYTHTQAQLDDYANQNNPNNPAYRANRNNHANQCNPNNEAYNDPKKRKK